MLPALGRPHIPERIYDNNMHLYYILSGQFWQAQGCYFYTLFYIH